MKGVLQWANSTQKDGVPSFHQEQGQMEKNTMLFVPSPASLTSKAISIR